jgi:SAM-dependent methyltransferase
MVEATVPRRSTILDAGCATGEMVARLRGRGYEVWGLDIAEMMIRHARERCGSDRLRVGDIEYMPFRDNAFDAVVCLGVLEYLDTDERALREMWRVLKPGGTAVVSTPSAICPLYRLDHLLVGLMTAVRPLVHFVKYRLGGRRAPAHRAPGGLRHRRYYRRRWLRLLRSAGLEPVASVCHGWGWYRSWPLALLIQAFSWNAKRFRRTLERCFGQATVGRAADGLARNRAVNWVTSEHLVRVRAVKSVQPVASPCESVRLTNALAAPVAKDTQKTFAPASSGARSSPE